MTSRAAPGARLFAPAAAFLLTAGLLSFVQARVARPMLLAERFLPGAGWAEVALLACYAAAIVYYLEPRAWGPTRGRLWLLFSAVFFGQLLLGLSGFPRFLMSGEIHLPVPAVIVAGPIFRGERFFMPILFAATLLFAGPAWCSWFCYFGSWDLLASRQRAKPRMTAFKRGWRRALPVVAVALAALGLRLAGVPASTAAILAISFSVIGVGIMLLVSRRTGRMEHCLHWCPVGFLATTLGRVSPFRLRVAPGCTSCGACAAVCRYDALRPDDLARGEAGPSCTLCGDCTSTCRPAVLRYRFPGLTETRARQVFLALVVSLHAACLGLARV